MKGVGIKGIGIIPPGMGGGSLNSVILPTQIPDMVLWLTADSIVAADGTPLAQWDDRSGLGNHCTQANAALRPIYSANGIYGKPEVALAYRDLGAGDIARWMTIPNSVVSNRNNITIIAIGRPISKAMSSAYTVSACVSDVKLGWGGLYPTIVCDGLKEANTILQHFQPTLTGLTSDAVASKIWYNGQSQSFAAAAALALTGGRIGTDAGGGYRAYGTVNEIMVYNRGLTTAEMAQIWSYVKWKYGLLDTPTKQVIFDGDSLTTGYACLNWSNYPGQLWGLLGSSWKIYCVPVAGQTLVNMIADGVAEVDSKYSASLEKNVVCCWAGLLDVYFGATPATALMRLTTYCQARQAAGWQVVVLTCLPSDYISYADRATLNAGIRANWATFADALADIAADTRIGDDGDELDPTYYNNSDGNHTHMTPAGFAIVAQIAANAIATLP